MHPPDPVHFCLPGAIHQTRRPFAAWAVACALFSIAWVTLPVLSADSSPALPPAADVPTASVARTNSLGMRFVRVEPTRLWFSIWETRRQDYAAFQTATGRRDVEWRSAVFAGKPVGSQPLEPVVCVNWKDATDFCEWLTRVEIQSGRLAPTERYRLPTDLEWSRAAGLVNEPGDTPAARSRQMPGYVWGTSWPPPPHAGNFADSSASALGLPVIEGFGDGAATTALVGSYTPNELGIHDLAGNVWEWCADDYDGTGRYRTLRGGAWNGANPLFLRTSTRASFPADVRLGIHGFRVVLSEPGEAPSTRILPP